MYIRLRRLDHVSFPGVRKSVSDQIPRICSPWNESNKRNLLPPEVLISAQLLQELGVCLPVRVLPQKREYPTCLEW